VRLEATGLAVVPLAVILLNNCRFNAHVDEGSSYPFHGWRDVLFHNIEIKMDSPVCNCCNGDYSKAQMEWAIWHDGISGYGLKVSCKVCKTELLVPHRKFFGSFVFNKSPSSKDKELHDQEPVDVVGNVVHLKIT